MKIKTKDNECKNESSQNGESNEEKYGEPMKAKNRNKEK